LVPAENRRDTKATWQGFSDALAHAVELCGTTVIFVLGGLWLDNTIGTRPLFTVVLGLLAVIGLGTRAYYRYTAQIRRDEEGKPWTHSTR
jgi:F0F1-type ATP synthase assembly protein I